jgi:hypothetical protein
MLHPPPHTHTRARTKEKLLGRDLLVDKIFTKIQTLLTALHAKETMNGVSNHALSDITHMYGVFHWSLARVQSLAPPHSIAYA